MNKYPEIRLRRIRQNSVRKLIDDSYPKPEKFIWPIFLVEGKKIKKEIESLPNQYYMSIDVAIKEVEKVINTGIGGILVFAKIDENKKSTLGEYSYDDNGLVQKGLRELRKSFPNLAIFSDIGLSGYTKIGKAQILNKGKFDNDFSLEINKRIALSHAKCGVTGIAPCGMIDGQVKILREHLDKNGFQNTLILSYSTKFHSNMYRAFPFNAENKNKIKLDKGEYQTSFKNKKLAVKESLVDEEEGADILMVKPALFYLDIIKEIKEKTNTPLAAYNVSGEYAMIYSMIEKGFAVKNGIVKESLCAIQRAGADIIISYWANQYYEIFK